MPLAPMRACSKQGCRKLTRSGRCEDHPREWKAYDAHRPNAHRRGYTSARWRLAREEQLRKAPLCQLECRERGRVTPATQVDHKVPATPGHPAFWDPSNHQSACASCHSRKTARENRGFGNQARAQQ